MGKEWLFWGGSSSSKSTRKGKSSGGGGRGDERDAPTGCMCAVLQLFDLHHLPVVLHHQPSFRPAPLSQDEPTTCGGLEAPRNSLELEEPSKDKEAAGSLALASTTKRQENLNIPVNIQIRTSCENKSPRVSISKARTDDLLSDCSSSSPGAKTPTLVARLMGLDQLPETTFNAASPSSTVNSQRQSHRREQPLVYGRHLQSRSCSTNNRIFLEKDITTGTLSLPETPRISSARRSDVEHRLSLQISNKENIMGEEFEFSAYTAKKLARGISESRREDELCRRGGHYARQIVKQVKERVSRKVGLDITNTVKSGEEQTRDDDDHVVLLKPNKPSNNNKKVVVTGGRVGDHSSQIKQSTPSCSPRLSEYYPRNKPPVVNSTQSAAQYSPRLSPLSTKPVPQAGPTLREQLPNLQQNSPAIKKCKKEAIASEKYASRLKNPLQVSDSIRSKKEEPFFRSATTNKGNVADKKCKKTPLSHDLLSISNAAPTLLPVKKDIPFPATATKLVCDKQASDAEMWKRSKHKLSSCSSQSYTKQQQQMKEATHILTTFAPGNIQGDTCRNGSSTTLTCTSTSPGIGDKAEASAVEYQYYIQRILKRTGMDKSTPVSLAKWYSPSRPLDPSIFHYIELFHPTTLTAPFSTSTSPSNLILRSNRRLIFQLVDELLAEILKPYLCMKPRCHLRQRGQMCGSELVHTLCSRISKFPSANCQVLEDIDALVDADLQLGRESFEGEEEGEEIVSEIERGILESLVHETAMEAAAAAYG